MLQTLDRHLFIQFTRNLLLVLLAITTVFMLLDVLLGFPLLVRPAPTAWYKVELFINRLPALFNFALPVSAVIAALACVMPMLRRGEFIALGAAGITTQRATRMLLIGCLLTGVVDVLIADFLTPPATAHALAMQDYLEGQNREGRVWRTKGSSWFAGGARLIGVPEPELHQVAIASVDRLAMVKKLVWRNECWQALTGVTSLRIEAGAQRLERLPPGPLPTYLALDLSPKALHRQLLPRYTLTSAGLLARGERADIALVWSRWTRGLIPVLAAMAAMAMFVRFRNRDRVVVAAIEGLFVAMIPVALLTVAGMSSDTAPGPPWVTACIGVILATMPATWLWLRWKL